ncbi:MAG TPA: hypothetical protein VLN56_08665 [Gammaproteobacteria bacterium]|nr:hypothetical protein [Gammaproteobacteria bacterium]
MKRGKENRHAETSASDRDNDIDNCTVLGEIEYVPVTMQIMTVDFLACFNLCSELNRKP